MSAHRSANATVAAHGAKTVTPSDSTELEITRGVFVGTTGDLTVTMADGHDAVFVNIASGTIVPIQVSKIKAATTATDILALY